jgi:outer membrane protein assembly factor BamA
MKWRLLFSLALLHLAFINEASALVSKGDCLSIRHIQLKINDVYEVEDEPNFFESTLNFLHFKTRARVIKEELLFQEGDCLDRELTEETARNLRSLPIFSDARITISSINETNEVDILITTKDRFTLRAEVSASHNSGSTKTRLSFGDKNLFGQNKALHFSQTDEDGEKLTRYVYKDGRFLHDYSLYASYSSARDGGLESYSLANPYRALNDKYAYFIAYNKNTQNFVYKLDDNEEVEIPQYFESERLGYSYEFGSRTKSKRLGFTLSTEQQNYFSHDIRAQASIPDRLEKIDLDLTATLTDRHEFIVMQGLDSLVYREDIELFKSFIFGLGLQQRDDLFGIEYHPKYQFGFRQTRYNQENLLSSYYFNHSGRYYAGNLLETATTAFYHCYYLPKPGQVWLGGLTYQYRYGRDILNEPLSMGGDVGFRGYKTSSFTGNKSLLFNLEFRHRLPSKWSKVAIGQAFFADTGFAWKKGEDMRLENLKANVGWGLRFDIPSIFGKDILRFDLAVATETGDVLASITLGQIFRYNELTQNNQQDF